MRGLSLRSGMEIRMEFIFEPELQEYMKQKNQNNIIVQVAETHSDIEIQEIHVHLISDKMAQFYISEKNYKVRETTHGRVLLPKYPLEYEDRVVFGLKKFWFFKTISFTGIGF